MKFKFGFLIFLFAAVVGVRAQSIQLTDEQALEISKKLWRNECGGTVEGLTSWNKGEEFASLGIGHFIWYPKGFEGPFEESFPKLVQFLVEKGVKTPDWLSGNCPWKTKKEFEEDFKTPRMVELRALLENTVGLQARFAANRLEAALPKMLESLPVEQREAVKKQFYRVASAPHGFYALMDYVNFKGEGVNLKERYNGEGWGLLQVLQGMKGEEKGQTALDEFAASAEAALTRRIKNSPPQRGEARWLTGWKNRLETYRQ
ncbi:MAG: hypothetical protein V1746_01505 [bacterium]